MRELKHAVRIALAVVGIAFFTLGVVTCGKQGVDAMCTAFSLMFIGGGCALFGICGLVNEQR